MWRSEVGGLRCEERLDVCGRVAPPRRKVPLDPLLDLLPRHAWLGPVEDSLHVVPVRVKDVGSILVRVVALADARRAVVAPAIGECGGVEPIDRLSIGGDEGEVKRACRLSLDQRQVFSTCWS